MEVKKNLYNISKMDICNLKSIYQYLQENNQKIKDTADFMKEHFQDLKKDIENFYTIEDPNLKFNFLNMGTNINTHIKTLEENFKNYTVTKNRQSNTNNETTKRTRRIKGKNKYIRRIPKFSIKIER